MNKGPRDAIPSEGSVTGFPNRRHDELANQAADRSVAGHASILGQGDVPGGISYLEKGTENGSAG
jgi:hypothetical protein